MVRNLFTVFMAVSCRRTRRGAGGHCTGRGAIRRGGAAISASAISAAISASSVPASAISASRAQYPQAQYPQGPPYPQAGQPGGQPGPEAQSPAGSEDPAADRQHGVARISIAQGDVNVKRSDSGELVAAAINAPLTSQDHLQTSPGSRAEVELDSANLIRLAPNTDLGFADLEYHRYQVQLGAGTIIYRVLRVSDAQAEVDTPSIAVHPVRQGEYRISVLDDGTTQITVRSGQAEIYGPRGSQQLDAGRTTLVRGNPSDPEFQTVDEIAPDQFDDWSANRDRELLASQSYQYVSRDIYGADDLDAYGSWVPSQYGQVWAPRPPVADWSPYSYGHWSWVDYYGWSWVDDAPWGWAPYHYGRWFWNGGVGWCWWPGARFASYLWRPALVGFFGWGGFGVGGWAGLGWVALAPFELFHPWWGHGWRGGYGYGGYGRGDLAHMYRNAAVRGGAMSAAYNSFGGPGRHFSPATREQLGNASLFRGQMPVSPSRASFQFTNRQATVNPRLANAGNRQFFQHQQVGQRAGFNGNGSRFGAATGSPGVAPRGVAPNMQGQTAGRSNYAAPRSGATGGWQHFGDPGSFEWPAARIHAWIGVEWLAHFRCSRSIPRQALTAAHVQATFSRNGTLRHQTQAVPIVRPGMAATINLARKIMRRTIARLNIGLRLVRRAEAAVNRTVEARRTIAAGRHVVAVVAGILLRAAIEAARRS